MPHEEEERDGEDGLQSRKQDSFYFNYIEGGLDSQKNFYFICNPASRILSILTVVI